MYAFNEALNAGIPFTDNGRGEHVRPTRKVYDGGFSVGGPVVLPKINNGRNRTFFFWNWEKYQDRNRATFGVTTVPTDALRNGDFSSILTGRQIVTNVAGRPIFQNVIYDPLTQTTNAAGQFTRQPFPNNVIPTSRIDPVAAKILATLPKPNINGNLVNNYQPSSAFRKIQTIPPSRSITISQTSHASPATGRRRTPIRTSVRMAFRVNCDHTLTPSLLLHAGAGVQRYTNPDSTPPNIAGYDEAGLLGIIGAPGTGYPRITGLGDSTYGGMALQVGPRTAAFTCRPSRPASRSSPGCGATILARRAASGRLRLSLTGPVSGSARPTVSIPHRPHKLSMGSTLQGEPRTATGSPASCWVFQQRSHLQHVRPALPQVFLGILSAGHVENHPQAHARLRRAV